jgi:hypothetical protein
LLGRSGGRKGRRGNGGGRGQNSKTFHQNSPQFDTLHKRGIGCPGMPITALNAQNPTAMHGHSSARQMLIRFRDD